jgi:hypothetical protein
MWGLYLPRAHRTGDVWRLVLGHTPSATAYTHLSHIIFLYCTCARFAVVEVVFPFCFSISLSGRLGYVCAGAEGELVILLYCFLYNFLCARLRRG